MTVFRFEVPPSGPNAFSKCRSSMMPGPDGSDSCGRLNHQDCNRCAICIFRREIVTDGGARDGLC
ncbi:MAG: hypothetical protein DWH78_07300 [Planctomycetota bacterium]|nr:MAG: hypothetical protein DWH78_07300 [Planctomycetota bacterium]